MADIFPNNVYQKLATGQVCIAFGIRLCPSITVVQLAQANGYDALFIDLEHSVLNESNAGTLCTAGLLANVTPFVRVPYQCGDGYVQRILDAGAMGIVFPHISTADAAKAAVAICKYPPQGHRSMTGQLPQFSCTTNPISKVIEQANSTGSAVLLMIETQSAIDNIDSIAAVSGVDVLLIGSNDLSIELGVPGRFESSTFQDAVARVSRACWKHGKTLGLAGIYDRPDLHSWAINDLGARFLLAQQDSGWLARGSSSCIREIKKVVKGISNGH